MPPCSFYILYVPLNTLAIYCPALYILDVCTYVTPLVVPSACIVLQALIIALDFIATTQHETDSIAINHACVGGTKTKSMKNLQTNEQQIHSLSSSII